ncbi:SKP1 component dimerization domain-containing protein [Plasmodiophora brassicae]|uniref:SKP1 component dimerisation domain-containing protein n=1 Tax=Plasmodiophora brassicae TaxID=37360 RepID=A0A0G4IWI8_PLABS|nr:hypothetical protein PBRA_007388 [Plasmodiophora brassicae]SPQ98012.1 unnamed protein product [Plasmodiophora brassicae]
MAADEGNTSGAFSIDHELEKQLEACKGEVAQGTVTLVTSDGHAHVIPRSIAVMSEFIKNAVTLDTGAHELTLKHVDEVVIRPVIVWMCHHSSNPSRAISRPLRSANIAEIVGLWDANFLDSMPLELTFKVLLAANYLGLQALTELCCAKVASLMLGKTPKQIRKIFNTKDDFTPEEEKAIREEYAEFL